MKQFIALAASIVLLSEALLSQRTVTASNGDAIVIEYLLQGDSLCKTGDLKEAITAYKKEYALYPPLACYGLACAYAHDGQTDSAFKYIFEDLAQDSTTYPLTNPDFLTLRNDKRWQQVVVKSVGNIVGFDPNGIKDLPLAEKLWDMSAWDQAYYYEIAIAESRLGRTSPICKTFWSLKEKINKENQRLLDSIIAVKGWPKNSRVGYSAASVAFLIIQHSTLEKREEYLPTVKKLCEENEADWSSYALMYDRIQIELNKPQLYGSQIKYNEETKQYELYPIEDEKNVDKRRAALGMQPLADYVSQWGIKYQPK